jgi:hypothetical protein
MPPQAYRLTFQRFGLTHWSKEKKQGRKRGGLFHFRGLDGGHSLSRGLDRNHRLLMYGGHRVTPTSLCFVIKFKYLGSYFVPELNDTADI